MQHSCLTGPSARTHRCFRALCARASCAPVKSNVKTQMASTFTNRRARSSLLVVGVVLLFSCWWLLQLSACAADLKQATGDIEAALRLESRAFIASAISVLAITSGIVVGAPKLSSSLQVLVCLLSFPVACIVFLAFALFGGHASWVCAL